MFIELSQVIGQPAGARDARYHDSDDVGENPHVDGAGHELITPTMVAVAAIRSFHRRKDARDGQPRIGTRIVFRDGGGFAVTETYDQVKAMVEGRQIG